jgi:hypothetical protein
MRIIQVTGVDGDNVALFETNRFDNSNVDFEIAEAFDAAKIKGDGDGDINVLNEAEEMLNKQGILRVYTDEVSITVL